MNQKLGALNASASVAEPPTHLHRVQPGANLPAHLDAANVTAFAIDWASAAVQA